MSGDCDFGLIGLAVMGENLAAQHGEQGVFKVAVFNRTTCPKWTPLMERPRQRAKNIVGTARRIEELCQANLERPRKTYPAGERRARRRCFYRASSLPHLRRGRHHHRRRQQNTSSTDSIRRTKYVEEKGLNALRRYAASPAVKKAR